MRLGRIKNGTSRVDELASLWWVKPLTIELSETAKRALPALPTGQLEKTAQIETGKTQAETFDALDCACTPPREGKMRHTTAPRYRLRSLVNTIHVALRIPLNTLCNVVAANYVVAGMNRVPHAHARYSNRKRAARISKFVSWTCRGA